MIDIVTPRFQLAVLAALLCQVLQSVAMPTIVSAAEQGPPPRHSLIQRSAAASVPPTAHGTILQPSSAESTHITSPIEPHRPSVSMSPAPLPTPHHRTLTKHPSNATITAPATALQTVPGAQASGIATGQVTQTIAETDKGTVPPAMVRTTKSATSIGAVAVAPSSPPSSISSASSHSIASAGSSSASSSPGSRSALNLIKNSSVATLLHAPTPVVTTPPSSSSPSTPPSTPPAAPPSTPPLTGILTLTWTANGEPDLAGYKIYVGTTSGTYNFPASPFVIGKVTSYTVANLPYGQTYFIAMSAFDSAGNESVLSAEVSKSLF
jgi:hypothetical protein